MADGRKGTPVNDPSPAALNYLPRLPDRADVPIACIGSGFIMADCHLVAYRQAGFNPVAITSRTAANAAAVAERHGLAAHEEIPQMLQQSGAEVVDVAVPPDVQLDVIRQVLSSESSVRAILAQKPLGMDYQQARQIVTLCEDAGVLLAVNQNMRYDQSVRACRDLIERGLLGDPVLASIDMRAIPHWMPWQQRLGWVTLRIMSIHHLDTFRYWLGNPQRVYCSPRPDPRTEAQFEHQDGICLYILEFANGARAPAWDDVWAGPAREGAAADIGGQGGAQGKTRIPGPGAVEQAAADEQVRGRAEHRARDFSSSASQAPASRLPVSSCRPSGSSGCCATSFWIWGYSRFAVNLPAS